MDVNRQEQPENTVITQFPSGFGNYARMVCMYLGKY